MLPLLPDASHNDVALQTALGWSHRQLGALLQTSDPAEAPHGRHSSLALFHTQSDAAVHDMVVVKGTHTPNTPPCSPAVHSVVAVVLADGVLLLVLVAVSGAAEDEVLEAVEVLKLLFLGGAPSSVVAIASAGVVVEGSALSSVVTKKGGYRLLTSAKNPVAKVCKPV